MQTILHAPQMVPHRARTAPSQISLTLASSERVSCLERCFDCPLSPLSPSQESVAMAACPWDTPARWVGPFVPMPRLPRYLLVISHRSGSVRGTHEPDPCQQAVGKVRGQSRARAQCTVWSQRRHTWHFNLPSTHACVSYTCPLNTCPLNTRTLTHQRPRRFAAWAADAHCWSGLHYPRAGGVARHLLCHPSPTPEADLSQQAFHRVSARPPLYIRP
jgi:hypothetical protein